MLPPSQNFTGQASISDFFKPKLSQPDSIQSGSNNCHIRPNPSSSSSTTFEPPQKRPRVADSKNGKPRKDTIDRMAKWKFEPVKPSPTQADSVAAETSQAQPSRSQKDIARHEAFTNKLLGSNFTIDRHSRNQMQIEHMSVRDLLSPSGSPAIGTEEVHAIVIDDDDDNDGERASSSSNRFIQFASSSAPSSAVSDSRKGKARTAEAHSTPTYTPLEMQILELKAMHPGVLLIIEVGYKLKFYGEDARVASRILNIMCFPERNLLTAMIPVHRLHIHVKRLIQAGHKVGVVRQIETRALKAASKNAYTPFVRKLTALYTQSTWIDDLSSTDDMMNGVGMGGQGYTNQPKSLMAIVEQSEGGNGAEDKVSIGVVSVEVNTGHLTYDQFSDGFARSELETRIAHLAPAEVLVSKNLTKPTEKVLSYLLGSGEEGGVRIERLNTKPNYNQAFEAVTKFYRDQGFTKASTKDSGEANVSTATGSDDTQADTESATAKTSFTALVLNLPHLALIALAQIISHLTSFNLESIATLSTNFYSFSSRTTMLLNSNTLANLEIFRTTDGNTERGSLIWLLDKCKTAFGRRLLRKWVSRPLTDIKALEERLDAVTALKDGGGYVVRTLPELLKGLPDLERGLARMTYGRATPTELATVLLSLNRVTQEFKLEEATSWNTKSSLIESHLMSLAEGKEPVQRYLNQISIREARANNKASLFPDTSLYPAIQESRDNISIIEIQLRDHLKVIRKILKRPSLEYVSVAGVDYLVEVRVADSRKVPVDWLRISATKSMVRFHTPDIIRMTKLRDQHKETLEVKADAAFKEFVGQMCKQEYLALRNTVNSLAVLDVLVSLAEVADGPGYTRPIFIPSSLETKSTAVASTSNTTTTNMTTLTNSSIGVPVEIKGMRHPILEATSPLPYIPNDVSLCTANASPGVVLMGCNMGGKSTVARSLGLCIILAQIGSYLPCTHAKLGLHDSVFVRMGARDSLFSGKSTFMVEVEETAEILRAVGSKSLVILDELGRGTSTYDGLCIATGVLEYLLGLEKMANFVFITHYFQLGELERKWGEAKVRNFHMAFIELLPPPARSLDGDGNDGEGWWEEDLRLTQDDQVVGEGGNCFNKGGDIEFLYKLRRGMVSKSFGIHCARLAGLDRQILDNASSISAELQHKYKQNINATKCRIVFKTLFKPGRELDHNALQLVQSMMTRGRNHVAAE
ncbi:related to DNA mismatch repair protein [Melanopsichium pennsylvanicum]|uniref:DNA mismatch repair protein MSH3 n=2 Tax=Melanopsichium pennsylvanicum TaxID=63383 RepID=A0AAJ5C740_9BASI|nr:related to DNA mismatch repair protein [Melanopsichium pennsylvanicum]